VIVADNRPVGCAFDAPAARVIVASGTRTPAFARNQGVHYASCEWIVFIDADTIPEPALLDQYFATPPEPTTAVLAGRIDDVVSESGIAPRHSAARAHMDERTTLERRGRSYAQTANCAVRRDAFDAAGGFDDHARAGEDADLCFRLAAAGWGIEHRPGARVGHRPRATVGGLLAQLARHGSGAAWLNRRYPGEFPGQGTRAVAARTARGSGAALAALARGDRDAAALSALDALAACAYEAGRLLPNGRATR
jgi:hypothetical protein